MHNSRRLPNPPSQQRHAGSPRPKAPTSRTSALCAQCALPIVGQIVTAGGCLFHPECFVCFHCGERLECVAFYPEPAERREERLKSEQERHEVDESLRFYCHLDYHEMFSPRCKSCKTPIEGEVILACGAEWHAGHFFCAQCGDPFEAQTPFVEKDGYAWCVSCHTNRYSAKCKKCKRPVTDLVVSALGAEWHEECFCCTECGDQFKDGQFFLRGEQQNPVCYKCEETRLKQ